MWLTQINLLRTNSQLKILGLKFFVVIGKNARNTLRVRLDTTEN